VSGGYVPPGDEAIPYVFNRWSTTDELRFVIGLGYHRAALGSHSVSADGVSIVPGPTHGERLQLVLDYLELMPRRRYDPTIDLRELDAGVRALIQRLVAGEDVEPGVA
jgi:hypothetical protein